MKVVDARGHSCPIPVVMVRKAVTSEQLDTLEVLVDNLCSVENVARFSSGQGYTVTVDPEGSDFRMTLKK